VPTQILAGSPTLTENETDGTVYTLSASFPDTYTNGTLFDLYFELTADTFGTTVGVIEAFYDILIEFSLDGDTYTLLENTTLADINIEGGSSSTTLSINLTGIADPNFYINTKWTFYGNNTQGDDPEYQYFWGIGRVRVKEASISIIIPVLAVLSIGTIVLKRKKD